jgi:hypothetical protein
MVQPSLAAGISAVVLQRVVYSLLRITVMASITRPKRDVPGLRDANLHRLELLASELGQRGLEASIVAPPGRVPRLQVTHPAGAAEDVYVGRCQDSTWWFWWPWAERIAAAADLDDASARIEQVLRRPSGD